jgi:hypothetical protein
VTLSDFHTRQDVDLFLTVQRRESPDSDNEFGSILSYLDRLGHALDIGQQAAYWADGEQDDRWLLASGGGYMEVKRLSYASPLTIVFEVAPYTAPFFAASGLLWLFDRANRSRVVKAAADYQVAVLKRYTDNVRDDIPGPQPPSLEDLAKLDDFFQDTMTLELTERDPADEEGETKE